LISSKLFNEKGIYALTTSYKEALIDLYKVQAQQYLISKGFFFSRYLEDTPHDALQYIMKIITKVDFQDG
jgi:hypothetical protein